MIPLVAPCITGLDKGHMRRYAGDGLDNEWTVDEFERRFADRVGCKWAVAVNSGTSALTVAMNVRGLYWAQVFLPSYSCVAVRNAAESVYAEEVIYVDSEFQVRGAVARTVATVDVNVHLFGRATLNGVQNIEDWTLSLGAWQGLKGHLGVCSTHASKMISTGRGGVIFGNDEGLHEQVKALVHYESHTAFGYSFAMSSMQAALGVSQLAQLDSFIERRRELASRYTEAFRPAGIECPDADCGSVFFRYLLSTTDPPGRVEQLSMRGIEAGRGVYPPLHRLAGLPDDDFPGTTAAVNSLLSVPVHPSITDEQAGHIIESVLEVCAP